MKLKDALEIVLGLAEDNVLEDPSLPGADPTIPDTPSVREASQAQQEALKTVRAHWRDLP